MQIFWFQSYGHFLPNTSHDNKYCAHIQTLCQHGFSFIKIHDANDSNINYGVPATNKGPQIKEEKLLFLGSMMIWDYALMSQE